MAGEEALSGGVGDQGSDIRPTGGLCDGETGRIQASRRARVGRVAPVQGLEGKDVFEDAADVGGQGRQGCAQCKFGCVVCCAA